MPRRPDDATPSDASRGDSHQPQAEHDAFLRINEFLAVTESIRDAYQICCLQVWRELKILDPEMAAQVTDLGLDDRMAAHWACQPLIDGVSPSELVAMGRADEIRALLRSALLESDDAA